MDEIPGIKKQVMFFVKPSDMEKVADADNVPEMLLRMANALIHDAIVILGSAAAMIPSNEREHMAKLVTDDVSRQMPAAILKVAGDVRSSMKALQSSGLTPEKLEELASAADKQRAAEELASLLGHLGVGRSKDGKETLH